MVRVILHAIAQTWRISQGSSEEQPVDSVCVCVFFVLMEKLCDDYTIYTCENIS